MLDGLIGLCVTNETNPCKGQGCGSAPLNPYGGIMCYGDLQQSLLLSYYDYIHRTLCDRILHNYFTTRLYFLNIFYLLMDLLFMFLTLSTLT